MLWGKVIFVSATQTVRRLAPSKLRSTPWGEVVSLKDMTSIFGPFTTDIILADLAEDYLQVRPNRSNLWPSLSGLARHFMEHEILPQAYEEMNEDVRRIVRHLSELVDVPVDRISLIGSHILQLENIRAGSSDYDFSLRLTPDEANILRATIARIRVDNTELYTDRQRFSFQFNLRFPLADKILLLDLFPSTAKFPLSGATSWKFVRTCAGKRFKVLDVRWSHGPWPLLVDQSGELLVVQSNAFRGAFVPGDELVYKGLEVDVDLEQDRTMVNMIVDPFICLMNWQRYLQYDRDSLWLR